MNYVELSISSSNSAAFGIQSAGYAFSYGGTLYTRGCNENDVTRLNCSSACQDASQIFSNPYTLQNCMLLSALAPNGMTPGDKKAASDFSIDVMDPDFPSLARSVKQTIQGCLEEYCVNNCSGTFEPWQSSYAYKLNGFNNVTGPVYAYICPSDVQGLNADIGGIGVRQRRSLNDKETFLIMTSDRFIYPTGCRLALLSPVSSY